MGFSEGKNSMRKVCKMGLESIWINRAGGEVRMCGWTNYFIGKLTKSSIEEIWHGEKAERFRTSMLDESYRYCDKNKCPYWANGTIDTLMVEYKVPEYPKWCSLSYEETCNYVCQFCRDKKYLPFKDEKEKIYIVEKELNKFIGQLDCLSANGVGELFCSPSIMNMLGNLPYLNKDLKITLESNGSLFNEKNWKKISNLGRYDLAVAITVHSFHEDTYRFLSGTTLPVSNVVNNLRFIRKLREEEIIDHFEIATVVCERNFREMPEFVQYSLKEFNPDTIRLRFFEPYGVRDKSIEWFFDIRNPEHPYYKEFVEVMKHPILSDPRVWKWQGEKLSELKAHPYFDEQKKVKMLSGLMTMNDAENKLKKYLEKYRVKKFTLYGNGYVGQAFVSFLNKNNICFGPYFDTYAKKGECFEGHDVYLPTKENIRDYDLLIICSMAHDEIKRTLMDLEYDGSVVSLEEFINGLDFCPTGEIKEDVAHG